MADAEISANAEKFRNGIGGKLASNLTEIAAENSVKLDAAYARLTTLQAWRTFVLEQDVSKEALGFFSEAQNDGLVSSVLISTGMWRPAMKSLRSLIENILHCLYFKDHPIEFRQWDQGNFRITFRELFEYFKNHPDVSKLQKQLNAPYELRMHYKHLSNIVHSSAKEFRMTSEAEISKLWNTSKSDIGKWSTIQKNVLRDVNLLMLSLFNDRLQGAANKGLRESLGLCIPVARDQLIKTSLKVQILR